MKVSGAARARHLEKFINRKQRGFVLHAVREVVPFGENLWAVPLSVWWAGGAVGA